MSDWREDYEENARGVNPHDYQYEDDFFDSMRNGQKRAKQSPKGKKNEGCYIATCIYGSYDCPEVKTLRRFRDDCLATHAIGRAFIRVYYALSPKMVRCFGKKQWFQRMGHRMLDPMVERLNDKTGKQNS